MESPLIRPLTRDDAASWRALRLRALQEHPLSFAASVEDFAGRSLEEVAGRMPAAGGADALFGAFQGGRLVGSAGLARRTGAKEQHKGLLWGVYVAPEAGGLGLGRALVARVIAHARAHLSVLQTCVVTVNARARAIYLDAGFRSYGVQPRALRIGGVDYDDELLWLPLDEAPDSLPKSGLSDRRAP